MVDGEQLSPCERDEALLHGQCDLSYGEKCYVAEIDSNMSATFWI
jgi:hypothetical protein